MRAGVCVCVNNHEKTEYAQDGSTVTDNSLKYAGRRIKRTRRTVENRLLIF